ncbi:MAG: tetratricopeptide repeat protein [bacterium]
MDQKIDEIFDEATGDIAVGDLEAAIEKYRRCVELDPDFFEGWHALGMSLMKSGRHAEAVEAGLKAVELRPQDLLAWSSLSLFHVRNNQIKEAEAAGGKARILSWGGKIKTDS